MATGDVVRFTSGDPMGLWERGDTATDCGRESSDPRAPNIRLLRTARGELLALFDPYGRGLIERAELTSD